MEKREQTIKIDKHIQLFDWKQLWNKLLHIEDASEKQSKYCYNSNTVYGGQQISGSYWKYLLFLWNVEKN